MWPYGQTPTTCIHCSYRIVWDGTGWADADSHMYEQHEYNEYSCPERMNPDRVENMDEHEVDPLSQLAMEESWKIQSG